MRMLIAQRCLTQVQGVVKDQREECKVAEGVEAERYLDEGKKYVEQGDPVQASEKFYKAAEEAVKVLARRFALPEHEEAESRHRESVKTLEDVRRGGGTLITSTYAFMEVANVVCRRIMSGQWSLIEPSTSK
jgi:hypothetical protein